MVRNRTSVGLDVHARSFVACGLDGQSGEVFERRLTPDHEELAGWVRVLNWILWTQDAPVALERIAISGGLEPSVCCRTVRRLTGATWTEARSRGPEWVLASLAARCAGLSEQRQMGRGNQRTA